MPPAAVYCPHAARRLAELPFEERRILSVSGLNREARQLVESGLGPVWVEGEISNLSRPSSGHLYWSLKDAQAQVRCAMFRMSARGWLRARQRPSGAGARTRQRLRGARRVPTDRRLRRGGRRRRTAAPVRGTQAQARGRRPVRCGAQGALPTMPRRIGVITSPTGAALRDVLIALRRRFPATAVLIYPTQVQGAGAAEEIARTLALADKRADCDVLILTRGGGSLEDLWSFNEEVVARAIAALELPIIVGVGHEIDFTIADFVADLRAPTPSQAAELAVPEQLEWRMRFAPLEQRLAQTAAAATAERRSSPRSNIASRVAPRRTAARTCAAARRARGPPDARHRTAHRATQDSPRALGDGVAHANPAHRLAAARERWRTAQADLRRALLRRLELTQQRWTRRPRAASLSPLATLQRGYAIVVDADGELLTDTGATAAAPTSTCASPAAASPRPSRRSNRRGLITRPTAPRVEAR